MGKPPVIAIHDMIDSAGVLNADGARHVRPATSAKVNSQDLTPSPKIDPSRVEATSPRVRDRPAGRRSVFE